MESIEKLMRDVPPTFVICEKTGATKNLVLKAIMDGAKDFDSIKETVDLCNDITCHNRVEALLKMYLPIYETLYGIHKDNQHDQKLPQTLTCDANSCKRCNLNCKK